MCYGGIATFGVPVVNFAQVNQGGRFVFVLLRGGFDGLAAVVPGLRRRFCATSFAYGESELTALNDTFGLAPGLSPLRALWDANELAAVHAMAIPHRTRSHFDGQAILETGLDHPVGSSDGWMNRLLQVMSGRRAGMQSHRNAISLTGSYQVKRGRPLGAVDDVFLNLGVMPCGPRWQSFRSRCGSRNWSARPMARGRAGRVESRSCARRHGSSARTRGRTSRPWSSAAGTRMRTRDWLAVHSTAYSDNSRKD
jgi:hypothetical protein